MFAEARAHLRYQIGAYTQLFKQGGAGLVIRRYGRRAFVLFFVFYLLRDVTLYLVVPYFLMRHIK